MDQRNSPEIKQNLERTLDQSIMSSPDLKSYDLMDEKKSFVKPELKKTIDINIKNINNFFNSTSNSCKDTINNL